ncbi:DNA topoisomerase 2 [Enterospora canceri]|uniref:DNA topoisomerase 2 n=1 Tax=Enterospora canceri TaxID=1081671 RepID=A0A1Y1S9J2_9MICR|nr:DNA topoisomerase 2 [Enterospora canceri]
MAKTIEETYQKKTPKEHILLRPDTYIGSVEMDTQAMFVWDSGQSKIVQKQVSFVPGLYKIFDEILVNAADNKQRDPAMNYIRVEIDGDSVSIKNNGKGIPIEIHKKEGVHVPELIFGHLLTSSNYDDKEKKVTGGRNGYGAKLCNIFSKQFVVETASMGQKYTQLFENNMSRINPPEITPYGGKDYTKITFVPDYKRFGMVGLDEEIKSIFVKRVYDLCASVKGIKVYLNGNKINISGLKEYARLYVPDGTKMVAREISERWELVCAAADDQFTQVSFVNSICTTKGGTHVNHVVDQLMEPLMAAAKKKDKTLVLKPLGIKNSLFLFVNCLVDNPAFDSQTKENLTLKVSKFGSKCTPAEEFAKEIIKQTDVIERIVAFSRAKQASLLKKTDGTKTTKLSGIPKLEDANNAGTKKSSRCTLILTEGDSAKTLAVAGLSIVGRDNYGVFPLRGKLLNVREATNKQIMENAEISALKKILGLQHGKTYSDIDSLRYGKLMIMTDQDFDGSHIKGLIINFMDHLFPSLLKINGFLQEFITPIVRCSRKKERHDFFTVPEYEEFKRRIDENNETGWTIKYYKGLGTSTTADAKEYFSNLKLHVKTFNSVCDTDKTNIDLAFNKKKADLRKSWLADFTPGTFLDQRASDISVSDFVNKELILFSMADNIRSIPSVIDGLKPGQRKVLFSCFKRNLRSEIKVAQLVGYVSEHSAYHHGEASLSATIVNLAHDFIGSNNINLLLPLGQFGSRLLGGKDSASPRYIFTNLNPLVRKLFIEHDTPLLTEQTDDNMKIEPVYYAPIIPMVLVNGADGIGTGWATSIPNYNPIEIVRNIRRLLRNEEPVEMVPFYRNFTGKIVGGIDGRYDVMGKAYEVDNGKQINVTELPVGMWTQTFKEYLDSCILKNDIKSFRDYSTDRSVNILIQQNSEICSKLVTSISTTNMVCFDSNGRIKKYRNTSEILREFYDVRLDLYHKRKEHRMEIIKQELLKLMNRVRFIRKVVDGTLIVARRANAELVAELTRLNFAPFDNFEYLLGMKISSLMKEKIESLQREHDTKKGEYEELEKKTPRKLWEDDLDGFEEEYKKMADKEAAEIKMDKKHGKIKITGEKDLGALKRMRNASREKLKKTSDETQAKKKKMSSSEKLVAKKKIEKKITKMKVESKGDVCETDSEDAPWKKYQ